MQKEVEERSERILKELEDKIQDESWLFERDLINCSCCGEPLTNIVRNAKSCEKCGCFYWRLDYFLPRIYYHETGDGCPWNGCTQIFRNKTEEDGSLRRIKEE